MPRSIAGWYSAVIAARKPMEDIGANGSRTAAAEQSPINFLFALNVILAASFVLAQNDGTPDRASGIWLIFALFVSATPVIARLLMVRLPPRSIPRRQTMHELWGALIGVTWAAVPMLFLSVDAGVESMVAVVATLAIAGVGAMVLSQTPSAAIILTALIAVALAAASVRIAGMAGHVLGGLSLIYGLAIAGMTLNLHRVSLLRIEAKREAERQMHRLSLLLDDYSGGRGDWLWESDAEGRITHATIGLSRVSGVAVEAMIGKTLPQIIGPRAIAGWDRLQSAMSNGNAIRDHAVEIETPHGARIWQFSGQGLRDGNGERSGYRGIAHDVSEQVRKARDLSMAKSAAEQASETKSQALAILSHELRTPLNAIVGFAELLGNDKLVADDEVRSDYLRTILESSKHLQTLINDVLDVTRMEKGAIRLAEQEADAAELVEIAVKMCRSAAERNDMTIEAHLVDGIEIKGDLIRLKQVLINLITNAIKFSAAGTTVKVAFERIGASDLAFSVADKGIGIRRDQIPQMFEPFVQSDEGMGRRYGGIGLGLAIAKKIAMLHGGDVTLDSELGEGTTARLILPASRVTWPASIERREKNAA